MSTRHPIRRALVSVSDKTGLAQLATALHEAGVEIVSTGSTATQIAQAGVAVTRVDSLTQHPEILDGRVKTLHPRIHAGLLADMGKPHHQQQLQELDIAPFDLVVANLYPFSNTVAAGAHYDECIENIDIGGPAMVRAAAKNNAHVAVVVNPASYALIEQALKQGGFTLTQRQQLAAEAFQHTASYDVAVASWMSAQVDGDPTQPSPWLGKTWHRSQVLRYGENPHQLAGLYTSNDGGLAQAQQLHGKEMSYNNYVDVDAAWRAAHDHGNHPTVAVIKHANPCGIAVGDTIAEAHAKAHATDPVSAFGGVIAANQTVTKEMAEQVADVFTEVIAAPGYDQEALAVLVTKKNLRILTVNTPPNEIQEIRPIHGGILVQTPDYLDAAGDDPSTWTLVSGQGATSQTLADLEFAWRAVRSVKSNAILLAHDRAAVGVGMGQVNRVDSCHLAIKRAGERARGAVAASDAFFPFADGLATLIEAGVRAVVQPGGSVRDEEVIQAAQEAGITMYFTGTRHFAH